MALTYTIEYEQVEDHFQATLLHESEVIATASDLADLDAVDAWATAQATAHKAVVQPAEPLKGSKQIVVE